MKVCVALDDFSQEIMGDKEWEVLLKLKEEYPQLRVTMFTIPLQCSKGWLTHIKENYPWIELAVHGTDHRLRVPPSRRISQVPEQFYEGFTKWYKAPRWELSPEDFNKLREMGYKIATNKTNKFVGDYKYDSGKELIKDIYYLMLDGIYSWHGHVQSQYYANRVNPNGLPDVIDKFRKSIPKDAEFVWVSEIR